LSEHWQQFVADVPWFLGGRSAQAAAAQLPGTWQPVCADFARLFPALTRLLRSSFVTPVVVAGDAYVLYSWRSADSRSRSWLCPPPPHQVPPRVYTAHRVMLQSFGGIVERSNEPERSWLLNHSEVLTSSEAELDATFLEAYAWAFEGVPGGIPLDMHAYYSIAREANGNTTLCNRATGEVVLFAPDHAFDHVVPLAGCPEDTLYRIEAASSFTEWIDAISRQWE
jgi:hypothetical protein